VKVIQLSAFSYNQLTSVTVPASANVSFHSFDPEVEVLRRE